MLLEPSSWAGPGLEEEEEVGMVKDGVWMEYGVWCMVYIIVWSEIVDEGCGWVDGQITRAGLILGLFLGREIDFPDIKTTT